MKTSNPAAPNQNLSLSGALVGVAICAVLLIGFRDQIAQVASRGGVHPHAPDLALLARQGLAVQAHLLAALTALLVSLFMLKGAKGTRVHRIVGWIWAGLMLTTALTSFLIMELNPGRLSYIHLLSGWTAFATPLGVWAARTHRVALHRRMMTGLVVGGLLIAGGLTFIPGRLMWRAFFG